MILGATTRWQTRGQPCPRVSALWLQTRTRPSARRGFTLIELILVLALLATVLAISVPSLSRFFRSRNLESEATRFLALTRAAQSRAVAEGVPMVVWFDTKSRTYGMNADKSYVEDDPKAEQFTLDDTLELDLRYSSDAVAVSRESTFQNEKQTTSGLYTLHFNPDGFASLGSPEAVIFRQGKDDEIWVVQSRNRLNYELQTGKSTGAQG